MFKKEVLNTYIPEVTYGITFIMYKEPIVLTAHN